MTVVVGVDGAGRTHRLTEIAAGAGGACVWLRATDASPEFAAELAEARATGSLVVVDDAHRLGGDALRALAAAVRGGLRVVMARRPTIDTAELAELDEAVARTGTVEQLGPLDAEGIGILLREAHGRPATADIVDAVVAASAGLPAIAAALAELPSDARVDSAPPSLVARVQRRLAQIDPAAARLARIHALRLELTDDVLAEAAGVTLADLAIHQRALRDAGLLVPDGERLVPAVAGAVHGELAPAERRRIHGMLANALLVRGADALVAAEHLRAAAARSGAAARIYAEAGERLRFTDPEAALAWFDDAVDAGADPTELAVSRAEAAALAGLRVELDAPTATPAEAGRLALVTAAVAAHHGRADRAAQALLGAPPPGPLIAAPVLVATGQPVEARAAANSDGPVALRLLAQAATTAGTDPVAAIPLFIEAADAVEHSGYQLVEPDTAHALGAIVAVTAGDASTAEHLLARALAGRYGGPVGVDRHRLLLAWVRMRSGRYDTATAELHRLAAQPLPGRDRILCAALAAGVARRAGDIATLRESWAAVEQVLARRTVDLFQLEAVEELVVAAARLRQQHRVAPVLDELTDIVERLGRPDAWVVTLEWIRLSVALAADHEARAVNEDAAAVAAAMAALATTGTTGAGRRQRAQCLAAACWADVLSGDIDADAVRAAADALTEVELPWEGSRLAGQAAIRTADPAVARRLLERARELSAAEPRAESRLEAVLGGLSEREVEVARLVLAGRTHREIGAQLYIAPKTVEHHVARIRTKLGATTRAEFVAALRTAFDTDASAEM